MKDRRRSSRVVPAVQRIQVHCVEIGVVRLLVECVPKTVEKEFFFSDYWGNAVFFRRVCRYTTDGALYESPNRVDRPY
jgi:hypothetical protein